MKLLPLVASLGYPFLVSCAGDGAQTGNVERADRATLEEVARYGWRDMSDSGRQLATAERTARGGMLSRPIAVSEGADGALYVLDGSYQKIVVFNADGSLQRVILGGYGDGPGEFTRPRDMTVTASGLIVILDQGLRRLTMFDTSGRFVRTTALGGVQALRVVASNNDLFILRWYPPGKAAVLVYDTLGTLRDSTVQTSMRHAEFMESGEAGQIGITRDGTPVYGEPWPGTWIDARLGRAHGVELLGDVKTGTMSDDEGRPTSYAAAATKGLAQLADGTMAVFYAVLDMDSLQRKRFALKYHIAFLTPDGQSLVGVHTMPDGALGSSFAASAAGRDFFLAVREPFPQVVRFRLTGFQDR